jgi:hypothetical protein
MIDTLNNNQGIIAIMGILIAIIGFFITNRNISNISQKQESGSNSSNMQIGNINSNK